MLSWKPDAIEGPGKHCLAISPHRKAIQNNWNCLGRRLQETSNSISDESKKLQIKYLNNENKDMRIQASPSGKQKKIPFRSMYC